MHLIIGFYIPYIVIIGLNLITLFKFIKDRSDKNKKTVPTKTTLVKSKLEIDKFQISVLVLNMTFLLLTLPDTVLLYIDDNVVLFNDFKHRISNFFSFIYYCLNMGCIIILNRKSRKITF